MKKILIVDDQSGWRNFNTAIVNGIFDNNVIIHTASSASEGYNKILENKSEPYDYILTDMQMENDYAPKMAGEWFVEQIKATSQYINTKVVIISASSASKYIAQNHGVDYIPKGSAVVSTDMYKQFFGM